MLTNIRAPLSKALAPMGASLARAGISPDAVTVAGTTGAVAGALVCFTRGWFFVGTLIIWFFVMLDMVDGAVARARGSSTRFGALLDSPTRPSSARWPGGSPGRTGTAGRCWPPACCAWCSASSLPTSAPAPRRSA
jgi:hypothetical protein